MTIHNSEIAKIFGQTADLLEIQGDNPFRIRAYRTAALTIATLPKEVTEMLDNEEDLTLLVGIGKDLAEKIKIIVKTGSLPLLRKLQKKTPAILSELMKIEGLGPKRVKKLYERLHIKSIEDLERAIEKGKIRGIKGFGEKTEAGFKKGIQHVAKYHRTKLYKAIPIANALVNFLKKRKDLIHVEVAGSYRRHNETVADLDILVTAKSGTKVIDYFTKFDEVSEILAKGTTRATVRLYSGMQADLRVVPEKSYGAALLYFTGSKPHNIAIRIIAVKKKLKINEYGVFKNKKCIASKTEKDVYRSVGLSYIPPELRENRGEIEAAKKNELPTLVSLEDIRGDLHTHTTETDGKNTLEVMALAAKARGYEYFAITDHSKRLAMVFGLDQKRLMQQIKIIDKLNEKLDNFVILKSIELDILENGKLDLPNAILKELDLTVCSIHHKFNLSSKQQTERIIRAMDNPYFNILGHPTGRLINRREPYSIDLERIMRAAKERNCFLEINAQPNRLDLDDIHCKMAKELGVKMAVSTDAHSTSQLNFMPYGIYQARRGWLEKEDVINTRNLAELKKLLRRGDIKI